MFAAARTANGLIIIIIIFAGIISKIDPIRSAKVDEIVSSSTSSSSALISSLSPPNDNTNQNQQDHYHQEHHQNHQICKRQASRPGVSAKCPPNTETISPCTCGINQTTKNGLPEISCINYNSGGVDAEGVTAGPNSKPSSQSLPMPLDSIFLNLSDYLTQNGESKQYERLLIVNSRQNAFYGSMFHGISFHYVSIYETNLTTIDKSAFSHMGDSVTYLLVKGNRLRTIFDALQPLDKLETLILNLGLNSFKSIDSNSLDDMAKLQRITLNGVVSSVATDAFRNLTALQFLKITNQLESIAERAFNFIENERDAASAPAITIDLSNNKLDENSIEQGFIHLHSEENITLDLTYNWVRYIPEPVFRPFFNVNDFNQLNLRDNKFECGRCDSYWIMNSNLTNIRDRLTVNCYMNQNVSVWEYDWSHCDNETTPDSGAMTAILLGPQKIWLIFIAIFTIYYYYSDYYDYYYYNYDYSYDYSH